MLVLDVDGVLTDGGICYGDNNLELKVFYVRDGSGLKLWEFAGKRAAIITGRTSPVVEVRAQELGIRPVIQGMPKKLGPYQQILADAGLRPEQVCAIGDDVPDLPVLRNCGLAVAVADACPDVVAAAHYVTHAPGGRGAVREVIELILRCQGKWATLLEWYQSESV